MGVGVGVGVGVGIGKNRRVGVVKDGTDEPDPHYELRDTPPDVHRPR